MPWVFPQHCLGRALLGVGLRLVWFSTMIMKIVGLARLKVSKADRFHGSQDLKLRSKDHQGYCMPGGALRAELLLRAILPSVPRGRSSSLGLAGGGNAGRGRSAVRRIRWLCSADCKRGRRKGATSKNVNNRQKVSKSFSTLFDNFRAGQKRQKSSKSVKKFFDTFRQFSRGTFFPAPLAIR